jgi:serine/threonine protein kinase
MSSATAPPKPAAAAKAEEPEEGAAVSQPRLRVTLRLADIIQLSLVIGRSRFGEVKLAKSRQTDDIYALKALRKSRSDAIVGCCAGAPHACCSVLELFELNHCKNERPILQILKHPYIANLVSSFQDVRVIYFLMDYYPGGNLMRLLKLGKLGVSYACQITAQVRAALALCSTFPCNFVNFRPWPPQLVVALEFMHNVGIVHRDLQPSNILFDESGFIRVCDFNSSIVLSVQKDARAYSCVGCPFYMSPEVIKNRGHSFAADWWSLGCIVFEMLAGYPPFYDVNRLGCYQKVLHAAALDSRRLTLFFALRRFCWATSTALRPCTPSPRTSSWAACDSMRKSVFKPAKPTFLARTWCVVTRGSAA